jgi:hypothetical protein
MASIVNESTEACTRCANVAKFISLTIIEIAVGKPIDATRGTLNTKKTINKPNNTEKVVAIDIFLLTLPFRLLYIYSSTCFCNINSLIWLIEYMIQKTLPIISAKIVTV